VAPAAATDSDQVRVIFDNAEHKVSGRVARMIRWLLQKELGLRGTVTFNFSGASVKARHEIDEQL
jgi:hypothetical protein